MTTCKLSYRTYVPSNWIAIEYCHLEFSGSEAAVLEKAWGAVEYEKYNTFKSRGEEIVKKLKSVSSLIENLLEKRSGVGKYDFIGKLRLNTAISRAEKEGAFLESMYKKLKDDDFEDAGTLEYKAKKFLKDNGFVLDSSSSHGNELVDYVDIWKKA